MHLNSQPMEELNLNSVNQLIFVMVKCGVLFEVRTEFLNNISTSFVFKGLNLNSVNQLIFVMVKCGVLFEVRTGFLNNI
jgi:predicted Holliday junction resolvase-like endonuclease